MYIKLKFVTDIIAAHTNHRLCSLVGVEGGHAIGGSLGVLRTLYQVGVRYLTLTSTCDTPWAECASADRTDPSQRGGLTPFGKVSNVPWNLPHLQSNYSCLNTIYFVVFWAWLKVFGLLQEANIYVWS